MSENAINKTADELLAKLLDEELSKNKAAGEPEVEKKESAPQPFKLNIGGQEYTFNSPEEISQVVNNTLAAVGQKLQQLESSSQTAGQTNQPGSYVQSDEDSVPKLTPEQHAEFLNKMATNPIEAMEWLDGIRFGIKEGRPSKVIKEKLAELDQFRAAQAVAAFKEMHPEWPGGQAAQVLDAYRQKLGLPFTAEGLSAAYASAQLNGVLPPWTFQYRQFRQQQNQAQGEGQAPETPNSGANLGGTNFEVLPGGKQSAPSFPASRRAAPQVGRGGSAIAPNISSQVDELSFEQIRKIIDKMQQS